MIDFKWPNSSFQPRITIMGSNNFGLLGGCCLSFTSSLSKVTGFFSKTCPVSKLKTVPGLRSADCGIFCLVSSFGFCGSLSAQSNDKTFVFLFLRDGEQLLSLWFSLCCLGVSLSPWTLPFSKVKAIAGMRTACCPIFSSVSSLGCCGSLGAGFGFSNEGRSMFSLAFPFLLKQRFLIVKTGPRPRTGNCGLFCLVSSWSLCGCWW